MREKLTWLVIVFFLQSCTSTDSVQKKATTDLPKQWSRTATHFKIDNQVNLPDLAWWKHYNQPQLNAAIQRALDSNNSIQVAVATVDYAQAQLKQVKLNWLPGMSLLGGYSQMPALGDPGRFIAVLPLYVLNIFQQVKLQRSATHQVEANHYAQEGVRLSIIGQVAASYFTLLAQTEAHTIQMRLLSDQRKLLTLYTSQFRSGITSQDEIEALESQVQQSQAQLAVIAHNKVISENALRWLMNQNPGEFVLKANFRNLKTDQIIPGNLPAKVLENRPDVRQAQASVKAANAAIGVATASLLPSIKLDAFLGKTSNLGNVTLSEATVNAPVFNFPVFGQIEASKAQRNALISVYQDTVKKALRDVENDLSAFHSYSKQLEKDRAAYAREQNKCQLVHSRFKNGIDSQVETLVCQINLDQFELIINKDKLVTLLTIVALYQDLGGGYHGA
jgi:outer membrane protein TolC